MTATVPVGKYLFGLLGDEWPPGTVDVVAQLTACRLVSVEIDGTVIPVEQSRLLDLSSDEGTFAVYNAFPRFNTPGTHTLRYTWKQEQPFFFVYPYSVVGRPDPAPEFEGRRVFVAGEQVGDPVDGNMVLSYTLTVVDLPTAVSAESWGKVKQRVSQGE